MGEDKSKLTGISTGTKIFKIKEDDSIDIYRIKYISARTNSVVCCDKDDNLVYIPVNELKGYNVLESDGMFMISRVRVDDGHGHKSQDVIVSISKTLELQCGLMKPYAVCRQCINDVFYNLISQGEDDVLAGLAINRDNCPTNFDFGIMMTCNKVFYTDVVYFYREDTIEDILKFVHEREYDNVLETLYNRHLQKCHDPKGRIMKSHAGWCRNLRTLLKENNFQTDIDNMLGITTVDFRFGDYVYEKPLPDPTKGGYYTVTDDMKLWLSGIFRLALNDVTVLEYNHDINLADLNNTRYFIIRSSDKKLYICVYTLNGEYLESDLQDEFEKKSFVDEWRINFVNKYLELHPEVLDEI